MNRLSGHDSQPKSGAATKTSNFLLHGIVINGQGRFLNAPGRTRQDKPNGHEKKSEESAFSGNEGRSSYHSKRGGDAPTFFFSQERGASSEVLTVI